MLRATLLILAVGIPMSVRSPQEDVIQKELKRLDVPASLVPQGKQPLLLFRAEGVQTYTAEEKEGKLQWASPSIPEAKLFDYRTGEQVGTHSKGPIWQDMSGSKISKIKDSKPVSTPAPNASAIPWLLIDVKSDSGERFAKVTNVQRVDTWGGLAPEAAPKKAGDTQSVKYEATYVLLGDK